MMIDQATREKALKKSKLNWYESVLINVSNVNLKRQFVKMKQIFFSSLIKVNKMWLCT